MCAQCMAAVATSGAAATGIRTWLATRGFSWLTPQRLKRVTFGLIAAALVVSSLAVTGSSGSGAEPAGPAPVSGPNGSR